MLATEKLRIHARLAFAKALRDDVAETMADGVLGDAQDVRVLVALGEHEVDVGARRDRVGPLDVKRNLR